MTIKKSKILSALIITIIISGFLYTFYKPILTHPNDYLFSAQGDAIKNYYTPAYYVKYDHGTKFTGMNYPFGEHVLFTDNQFSVTYFLSLLQRNGINAADYTTGIINILIILSIYLCAFFIWLLLCDFEVNTWFGAIMASGITLLSPQIQRLSGHYSLSYLCVIPACLFGLKKILTSDRKWMWWLFLVSVQLFSGFMHLYFAAMTILFFAAFIVFYLIKGFILKQPDYKNSVLIFSSVVLPFIIIQLFIHFTNTITDRTTCPWGIEEGTASFKSIFIPPSYNPFNLIHRNYFNWEGYGYIGILGVSSIIAFTILSIRSLIKKHGKTFWKESFNNNLEIFVAASIPVLLFSMLIPFNINDYYLLHKISIVRQFRSTGRFNWVFYYVITVWASIFFFKKLQLLYNNNKKVLSVIIGIILVAILFIEGRYNVIPPAYCISSNSLKKSYFNNKEWADSLQKKGFNTSDFQAMLLLPYFHMGSEKFWLINDLSADSAINISYNTGLPIAEGYLSRTSFSQTYSLLQIAADTLIQKNIYSYLPNSLPILLITTDQKLSSGETYLVKKSKLLFKRSNLTFYIMPVSILKNDFKNVRQQFAERKDSMCHFSNYYTNRKTNSIICRSFATGDSSVFISKGSANIGDGLNLYYGKIPITQDSEQFEFSIWNKINYNVDGFPYIFYYQYDTFGHKIDSALFEANDSHDVYPNWAKATFKFKVFNKRNIIDFHFWWNKNFEAERMLIRPAHINVYYDLKSDGSFVLNNYPIPAKDDSIIHF